MAELRIFISSPGDVELERQIARRVLARLDREFVGQPAIIPYFWEYEPMRLSQDFQSQIPPPSSFDIVICVLWARLGSPLGLLHRKPDGTPYQSGTEYEFEDAVAGFKARGAPDILVYRNRTDPPLKPRPKEALERQLAQLDALEIFLERWTREGEIFKGAITTYTDVAQFEELLTEHLRKLIGARCQAWGMSEMRQRSTWTAGSPFRGLEAFEYEHATIFRGRTRAIDEVIGLVRRQVAARRSWTLENGGRPAAQFVIVAAASGMGKSSMVRAGVIPLLTSPGVVAEIAIWRRAVIKMNVDGGLLEGLVAALVSPEALPELAANGTCLDELTTNLRANPAGFEILVRGALSQAAAELKITEEYQLAGWEREFRAQGRLADAERCHVQRRGLKQREAALVLVLDQFEELFASRADEQRAMMQVLDALSRGGRVVVIATLRSDFLARLPETAILVGLAKDGALYQLEPPSRAELAQMIREPAREAGVIFEQHLENGSRLDDVILEAMQDDPASLPLMEFALEQLYLRRSVHGVLLFSIYRELDGVEGAIARRAEETYAALDEKQRSCFDKTVGALVNLSELGSSERPIRRRARTEELTALPGAAGFVGRFVAARLLVVETDNTGKASVSVAHEALFSRWGRLKEWIDTNRDLLRIRARVEQAAGRWEQEARPADLLLSEGRLLAEARDLIKHEAIIPLAASTKSFVAASSRAQEHRLRQRLFITATVAVGLCLAGVLSILQWDALEVNRVQRAILEYRRGMDDAEKAFLNHGPAERELRSAQEKSLAVSALRDAVIKAGGHLPESDPADMAKIHEYLAVTYAELGDAGDARQEFEQSDAIARIAKDKHSKATLSAGLGSPYVLTVLEIKAELANANRILTSQAIEKGERGPLTKADFDFEYNILYSFELTFAYLLKQISTAEIIEYNAKLKMTIADLYGSFGEIDLQERKVGEVIDLSESWLKSARSNNRHSDGASDEAIPFSYVAGAMKYIINIELKSGKSESALSHAHGLLDLYVNDPVFRPAEDILSARVLVAKALSALGRKVEANREIEDAVSGYTEVAKARIPAAWQRFAEQMTNVSEQQETAGDLAGAVKTMRDAESAVEKASDSAPDTLARLRSILAWRYDLAGRFQDAETSAKKALLVLTGESSIQPKINLAHALLFGGKTDAALELYDEIGASRKRNSDGSFYFAARVVLNDLDELSKRGHTNVALAMVRARMKVADQQAVADSKQAAKPAPRQQP